MKDSRGYTELILDSISEGFILLDSRDNLLLINRMARTYLGCEEPLVISHARHLGGGTAFTRALTEVRQTGRPKVLDLELHGRVLELRVSPVEHRAGVPEGSLVITLTDVTANRGAVQTRRDFFSNASHELKTPITSIQGCAELLCSDIPLSAEQRSELLGRIGLETERMGTLINDIIMINRLESGDVVSEREPLDFEAVVNECCREIIPFAERSGLTLNADTCCVRLMANQRNLHELVSNLLMNAVKYNRPGGHIDVRMELRPAHGVLIVRNDGEPIPPEHQGRVFERFYRVDRGRSKTAGGTGLGLSIVKHVVDSLGGSIRLASNAQDGTTFTVILPRIT